MSLFPHLEPEISLLTKVMFYLVLETFHLLSGGSEPVVAPSRRSHYCRQNHAAIQLSCCFELLKLPGTKSKIELWPYKVNFPALYLETMRLTTERSSRVWLSKWCFPVSMVCWNHTNFSRVHKKQRRSRPLSGPVPNPERWESRDAAKRHDTYLHSFRSPRLSQYQKLRLSATHQQSSKLRSTRWGPTPCPGLVRSERDFSRSMITAIRFSLSLSPSAVLSPPAKDNNNQPTE